MSPGGCPGCGQDRLKSGPVSAVDLVLNVFSRRRRYVCSSCGWMGRRHRLKRRGTDRSSLASRGATPSTMYGILFVIALAVVLVVSLAAEGCSTSLSDLVEGGTPE